MTADPCSAAPPRTQPVPATVGTGWGVSPIDGLIAAEVARGRWADQDTPGRQARVILDTVWRSLMHTGRTEPTPSEEVALGWLTALVAVPPGTGQFQPLRALLTPGMDTGRKRQQRLRDRRRWFALGMAGPLAYAAGLSLTEAEARTRAGGLAPEHLLVLAGMRGWTFPEA